jgi:hypothetical protein
VVEAGRLWGVFFRSEAAVQAGAPLDWRALFTSGVLFIPAIAIGIAIALWPRFMGDRRALVAGAGALLAAAAALLLWNGVDPRSEWQYRASSPDLAKLVGEEPGPVMWVNGETEAWFVLNRPNWYASLQCAGIVFSRKLAMDCGQRAQRAVALGLADRKGFDFTARFNTSRMIRPDDHSIRQLCRQPDAPVAAIIPAAMLRDPDRLAGARRWRAPSAVYLADRTSKALLWIRNDSYIVVRCAALRGG